MTIKAILFDHDGTLVDSEPSHFKMWERVLKSYGVDLTMDDYKQNYAGVPTSTNAIEMVKNYPSVNVDSSILEDEKNIATRRFLSGDAFPLMDGAKETIQYFKDAGLKIAVVTGAGREGIEATIKSNGLHDFLSVVVSGDDVENSKPSPDVYIKAMERLGVDSSECIAIEDTENGSRAAVGANVPCVAVPTEMSKQHDFSKALGVFDNIGQAKKWISEHYLAYM